MMQPINACFGDGRSDSVEEAIKGGDKRGDNLVRRNHQRHDQNPPDRAENGAKFAQNGAEFVQNGAIFCWFGSIKRRTLFKRLSTVDIAAR
jgi:hypothetical protein